MDEWLKICWCTAGAWTRGIAREWHRGSRRNNNTAGLNSPLHIKSGGTGPGNRVAGGSLFISNAFQFALSCHNFYPPLGDVRVAVLCSNCSTATVALKKCMTSSHICTLLWRHGRHSIALCASVLKQVIEPHLYYCLHITNIPRFSCTRIDARFVCVWCKKDIISPSNS